MKTIADIQREIKSLQEVKGAVVTAGLFGEVHSYEDENAQKIYQKNRKRIQFLHQCRLYLESNPRQDFAIKMKQQLEWELININDRYELEYKELISFAKGTARLKAWYKNESKQKKEKQVAVLNYLLSQ